MTHSVIVMPFPFSVQLKIASKKRCAQKTCTYIKININDEINAVRGGKQSLSDYRSVASFIAQAYNIKADKTSAIRIITEITMNINDIVLNSRPVDIRQPSASDAPALCCEQPETEFPKETPVAMLYVPFQQWRKVSEPMVGLDRGTVFEELDKPFIGERM